MSELEGSPGHAPDGRVQTGRIAAAGQDSDSHLQFTP